MGVGAGKADGPHETIERAAQAEYLMSMTYVDSTVLQGRRNGHIKLHGPEAFEGMRKAGQLTAQALDLLVPMVKPGVTTDSLDKFVFEFGHDHNAYPAPLNYRGYRKSICTSINHVVCHGIPDDKPLRDGDIVNIDVTFILEGWHGDASRMYVAGTPSRRAQRLIEVTYECLLRGIAAVKPGGHVGDIGHAIQTYAEGERCSVVRDFCGHGLGRLFHDEPNILHAGKRGEGAAAEARHVLHHRADDQSRRRGGEGAERRLDGGDAGPLAVAPSSSIRWR